MSKLSSHKSFFYSFRTFFVFALIVSLAGAGVAMADGLTDAEKAQKRDELEKFFTGALQRSKAEPTNAAPDVFRLTANASTRYGYESNVDLNNTEDGDEFYQEKVGAKAELAPEFWAWGDNRLSTGVEGRYEYWGYFDRDDLNRQTGVMSPYLKLDLGKDLSIETAYVMRIRHYDTLDQLNYLSQGVRVSVDHRITTGLSQRGTFTYEHNAYSDRPSLTPGGLLQGSDREDERYEGTYGLRYRAGRWTFNAEGNWVRNDSTDQYFDYNDYDEGGLNGSVSYRLTEKIILTGFGGWEHRTYDSRPLTNNFTVTQEDDWYFAGGRAFYAINTWSGVDVTFTYYRNDSNDAGHDYSDTITSVGYHLYF